MYKKLFSKNKIALDFLIDKEELNRDLSYSITPISNTRLATKTTVGIADLITDFSISQLLEFAEWMEYHSKYKTPEQCVKEFLTSLSSDT